MKGLVAVELTPGERLLLASFVEVVGGSLLDSLGSTTGWGLESQVRFLAVFTTPLSRGNVLLSRSLATLSPSARRGAPTTVKLARLQAEWWAGALVLWWAELDRDLRKGEFNALKALMTIAAKLCVALTSRRGRRRTWNAGLAYELFLQAQQAPRRTGGRPYAVVAQQLDLSEYAVRRAIKAEARRRLQRLSE